MSESIVDTEEGTRRDSVTSYGESEFAGYSPAKKESKNRSNDQNSTPWYRRRRFWAIFVATNIILVIILLPIFFLVIYPAIAQGILTKSIMTLESFSVHLPMNETHFSLDTNGTISNGGPFDATVSFPSGAQIVYNATVICEFSLPSISVSGGNANLSSSTIVHIVNGGSFIDFVKAQMNDPNVTFTIKASATVKAMGITKGGLDLNKDVTLNGTNGFSDPGAVSVDSFKLDPIAMTSVVTVKLNNLSPITVVLGTLGANTTYKNVLVGPSIAQNVTMRPGINTITMNGTISPTLLAQPLIAAELLGKLNNGQPINVTSIGDFAKPDGINEISWLNAGVRAISYSLTLEQNKSTSALPSSLF